MLTPRRALLTLSAAALAACTGVTSPVDQLINLGPTPRRFSLRADPSERHVVVLQHGLWRSAASLAALQRALEHHGYEVLNESYPSTRLRIDEHATRLAQRIEAFLASRDDARRLRLHFVGHSMGGLVVRAYLARPDARRADTCVFIATPHRGAALTDARKDSWLFRTFLGDRAALELSPSDALYQRLGPVPCERIGNIVGSTGTADGRNDDVPGDDDGTVGVAEAQLPEQTDVVFLARGHTMISAAPETVQAVLEFLSHGRFGPGPMRRR